MDGLELTRSAISRPWQLHLNFSCQAELDGRFPAIRLIVRISGPGQKRPVVEASGSSHTMPFAFLLELAVFDGVLSTACRLVDPAGVFGDWELR